MAGTLKLPLIDLFSTDRAAAVRSIRQACLEYGFFYLTNHGIDGDLFQQLLSESKNFFRLPLDVKLKLEHNEDYRGYTPSYSEKLDPSSKFKDILPLWRGTMKSYYEKVLTIAKHLSSLVALSLNLDEHFFGTIGAPMGFLCLLHYPGELKVEDSDNYGASAHSDYGMMTLLTTDGVPGLEICREKDRRPQLWEPVPHVEGAFIINIGDMLERWTNCLYRSTLHRVVATGNDRYSVAFFLDPNYDCLVECLETCCSENCPPRFRPVRCGEYIKERLRSSYSYSTSLKTQNCPPDSHVQRGHL